jgi:Family of unknown function (DUF6174)
MLRTLWSAAALTATLALTGCGAGSTGDPDTAADPGTPAGSSSPSPSPSPSPTPSPTLEPGSYPAYPHDSYTYVLRLQCYCPSVGEPIDVTVTDGVVTSAVWGRDGQGWTKGDDVGEWGQVTLDEIIDRANDTGAYEVEVDWAPGDDHPTRVSIDQDKRMVDEEITYLVSDVEPAA